MVEYQVRHFTQRVHPGPGLHAAQPEVLRVGAERHKAGADTSPLRGQAVDVRITHHVHRPATQGRVRLGNASATRLERGHYLAREHHIERRTQVEAVERSLRGAERVVGQYSQLQPRGADAIV